MIALSSDRAFLAIAVSTFLSEDATLAASAALMAAGKLAPTVVFAANVTGIIVGDLILYGLGRWCGPRIRHVPWLGRRLTPEVLERGHQLFRRWGAGIVIASRFLPGSRIALYSIAGVVRAPFGTFALSVTLVSLAWVALVCGATRLHPWVGVSIPIAAALAGALAMGWRRLERSDSHALRARMYQLQKWRHFEFWPAWFFYAPVVLYYFWLALRYRSWTLPSLANPGIELGGLIGESKSRILAPLPPAHPALLKSVCLPPAAGRGQAALDFIEREGLGFPVVLKPDVGQRGSGVRLVPDAGSVRAYLADAPFAVIVQEHCADPREVGVYYCRAPGEARGRVLSITEKTFPRVMGDGRRTLARLILDDARARFMAPVYFARHAERLAAVLAPGEGYRLVHSGNHCQGTVFSDGRHLHSPALEQALDALARQIPGFRVGRFDLRYREDDDLRAGRGFKIIELNGAAGEATHIYDARGSLAAAYHSLFSQLHVLFRLGDEQRRRGLRPAGFAEFWRVLRAYYRTARFHPPTT